MRNHKQLILLLVSAVVVAACGTTGSGDSAVTSTATGTESVTLKVIMEEVPDTDIVQQMLADFETESGTKVEVEALPYDQMRDRIVTSSLAPTPTYDVIIVDNPWMIDFVNGGYILALDDYIDGTAGYDYEDFAAPLRQIGEVDGSVYGVPFYNYALAMIYRSDLIDQAPTTIEEYQALVAGFEGGDVAGLAMQPQRGYKIFEEWANWLYAFGGRLTDDAGEVVFDSEEARVALQAYIDTYNASAPSDSLNWGFDEALRSVAGGEAASMISYNWMLPTLNKTDGPAGDLAGSFEVAEVPGGVAVLGAWHWAISATAENPDAAWEFISWISGAEKERQRVISGGAPTRSSVMSDPDVWEQGFGQHYYETVAAILEDAIPLASGPNAEEVIEIVGAHLNAAVAGIESVDEAIAAAAEEAAAAFKRAAG